MALWTMYRVYYPYLTTEIPRGPSQRYGTSAQIYTSSWVRWRTVGPLEKWNKDMGSGG